ncbi:MAG: PAS domain-containing protein [Pseudomonadota bacterium]
MYRTRERGPAVREDLSNTAYPFSLTFADPRLPDTPLVHVSETFERVTGYDAASALGSNCRFLQGEATNPETVERLNTAVRQERDVQADIYNYRADGSGFWNRLVLGPLRDDQGKIRYHLGIQFDLGLDDPKFPPPLADAELGVLQRRVKGHLSRVLGLIGREAERERRDGSLERLARRAVPLQLLYRHLGLTADGRQARDTVPLRAYLDDVASVARRAANADHIDLIVEAGDLDLPTRTVSHMGLILLEMTGKLFEDAFADRRHGLVRIAVRDDDEGRLTVDVTHDGDIEPLRARADDLNEHIMRALITDIGAHLDPDPAVWTRSFSFDHPISARVQLF